MSSATAVGGPIRSLAPCGWGLVVLAELQGRAPSPRGKNLQNNPTHRRSTLLWRACDLSRVSGPTLIRPQLMMSIIVAPGVITCPMVCTAG